MAGSRRCLECGGPMTSEAALPFCSERCRIIDLGKWLDQSYVLAAERVDVENLPERAAPNDEDSSCD